MPRVMVISEHRGETSSVLLDEQVSSIHLDSEHSAWQFVERLGWAISDAEEAEISPPSDTPAVGFRSSARAEHSARTASRRLGRPRRQRPASLKHA